MAVQGTRWIFKIDVDEVTEVFILKAAFNFKGVVVIALHHGHRELFVVLGLAELPA